MMRILIDLQGAQTESRFRGIGRYSLALAQAIVRNRADHQVFILLSKLFPNTIDTIEAAFADLLPASHIFKWDAPGPVNEMHAGNQWRRQAAELIREAFIADLQPDIVHIPSIIEGHVDDAVTSIGQFQPHITTSVTIHDLIPLLNPEQYLKPNPPYQQFYQSKIEHIKKASLLIAISESSRREAVEYLQYPEQQIVNTYEGVDACFRRLNLTTDQAREILEPLGITRPYLLYTGSADERKNLPRLVQAYARINSTIRKQYQLVFAGFMQQGHIDELTHLARQHGLKEDELIFVGYVTDEQLVQIYNLCKVYVFPSWHEGFGLPVLEAMQCGAPVIGANATSLPEVIGNEQALFDPGDVDQMAQLIQRVLTDDGFYQNLLAHGKTQAAKFSWDKTAIDTIAEFEKYHARQATPEHDWPTVNAEHQQRTQRLIDAIVQLPLEPGGPAEEDLTNTAIAIDANIKEAERSIRAQPLTEPLTWRLEGPFDSTYSLAVINRLMARALTELGHNVVLHSTEGPGDFEPDPAFCKANADLNTMYQRAAQITAAQAHVTSRNLYPPRVADMDCQINILHNYAWEESGFPMPWARDFSQYLQGIAVTAAHVKKIMIDHGVTCPIAVVGNGIDHWLDIQADTEYTINAKPFRFLHVSSCFPRKGARQMLEAFGKAFTNSDPVTLVIKTFANPHNQIHHWLEDAKSQQPNYPDVRIIEQDLSDPQLKAIYQQCHALLAPSMAEGFGLPLAEAMLTGLPVITTAWSGQMDFCNELTAFLVDYQFTQTQTHFQLFDSVWAQPDVDDLAKTIKHVYQLPESERNTKAENGKKLLLSKYRWRHVAQNTANAVKRWSNLQPPTEPHIGWISTWNTRCGLATYSAHLLEYIDCRHTIFAAKPNGLTAEDGPNVVRCWEPHDYETLEILTTQLNLHNVDTLVIQFNYGLFGLEQLNDFLIEQADAGRNIIITLHATSDPAHHPHKKLAIIVPGLKRCSRILVHSPGDLNRLKNYGLVENVTLFAHPILDHPEPEPDTIQPDQPFVIGTYGFFLPQKGLPETVEAIDILKKRGVDIKLVMTNAQFPAPESEQIVAQTRKFIDKHNLADRVDMNIEFLPDDQSLARLEQAHLLLFAYQNTRESASGAVRYGLSAGKPVAVTPLPIFEDVSPAVFQLNGTSAQQLADGIADLRQAMIDQNQTVTDKQALARKWRAAHRYSQLAPRLADMIRALDIDRRENTDSYPTDNGR